MTPELTQLLARLLQPRQLEALDAAVACAKARDEGLYLVGGSIRDLFQERRPGDLDLMTEGDAAPLARAIAEATGGDARVYGRFGTTAVFLDGHRLDVARARVETYARPGALPDVQPGSIENDLWRRDFTMNALAFGLTGRHGDVLLDPTGGADDIVNRIVRVLHEGSFEDDATRILRGLRYAARLNFSIEETTRHLMRTQARYLDTISAARLHSELTFVLEDSSPLRSLEEGESLGVLAAIFSGLSWDRERSETARLLETRVGADEYPRRLLMLLCCRVAAGDTGALAERLALARVEARLVERACAFVTGAGAAEHLPPFERALWARNFEHEVVETLAPLVLPGLVDELLAAVNAGSELTGADLLALGVPEGPQVGRVLRQVLLARLNGSVASRDDELALARRIIAEGGLGRTED
ncbi:MAG: hypothetical protein GEU28_08115 [Dehalococcoidia bacterium]|nr:hypothetical protein [Dehalococcoidia bacterium]